MRNYLHGGLFATLALAAVPVQAGSALFATTNIQYLYGTTYADFNDDFSGYVHDDKAGIITVEHFDAWKYGDNFIFFDVTNALDQGDGFATSSDQNAASFYGEISPRLSLTKIFGTGVPAPGFVQDILFTSTVELPESPVEQTFLYGLAIDVKIPKFAFFQNNFYVRDNQSSSIGQGYQYTAVWLLPFTIGKLGFAFEGFLDYAFGEKGSNGVLIKDNLITAPRLLVDVGGLFGAPGTLQAGCEYQIWRNKFGIDGMDEDVAQAMVKWIW